ncbi:1450_t:CDS:1, partial [Racocetra fulgida]
TIKTNSACYIFDSRTKDIPIFTEDERNHTISEACIKFKLISNFCKLDISSDTESQMDLKFYWAIITRDQNLIG